MQEYITFFSNHALLSIVWVILLGMLIYSFGRHFLSSVKEVSSQQLSLVVNKQDGVVVDVRGQEKFGKGHIPGALNAPMSQVKEKNFSHIEKFKDNPIILVCEDGQESRNAGRIMQQQGFSKVSTLKGGLVEWRAASMPLTKKR